MFRLGNFREVRAALPPAFAEAIVVVGDIWGYSLAGLVTSDDIFLDLERRAAVAGYGLGKSQGSWAKVWRDITGSWYKLCGACAPHLDLYL